MKVAVVGLGPIGIEVARAVLAHRGLKLVAAADVQPALAGRPLGELVPGAPEGLRVDATLDAALARGAEAVALCTLSRIDQIEGDLARAIAARVHVVSSCEELAAPPENELVARIDRAARAAAVTIIGTGVNPGFVMDRLPLALTGVSVRVDAIRVERVLDAGKRREPLRRKVGHGLSVDEFRAGVAARRLGHVGLPASASLLARGLGTRVARFDETIDPVLDGAKVLGVRQRLTAQTVDGRAIELSLQMSVGAVNPHDRIVIEGDPPLDVRIAGGTHGDRATVGAMLDAIRRLPRAPRGLITVVDMY